MRAIKQGELPDTVSYILKFPTKGYRVSRVYRKNECGERIVGATGQHVHTFKHGKEDLRPGERIDLFRDMKHLGLDQLAMAGGEDVGLLKQAKRFVERRAEHT